MSAQLGVASGIPSYNSTVQFQLPGLNTTGPLQKVANTAEAFSFRGMPGSEDVLLDVNDPEIAYFRHIDVNGNVYVDRRRCIAEPEPTIEEIADQKYASKTDVEEFREEMRNNVRELTESINRIAAGLANLAAKPDGTNETAAAANERTVIHAAKRPRPAANVATASEYQSQSKTGG